jgi:hypothetical protein
VYTIGQGISRPKQGSHTPRIAENLPAVSEPAHS